MIRPKDDEYAAHFRGYVTLVPEEDVLAVLQTQMTVVQGLKALVSEPQETFAYASGKWTVREVIGHVCDVERIFGFRAFAFSRSDRDALPGFDDSDYVAQAEFNATPLAELVDDLADLRATNLRMLRRLRGPQWDRSGIANGRRITVRALAFVMAGHIRHHLGLLRDRYGIPVDVSRRTP